MWNVLKLLKVTPQVQINRVKSDDTRNVKLFRINQVLCGEGKFQMRFWMMKMNEWRY